VTEVDAPAGAVQVRVTPTEDQVLAAYAGPAPGINRFVASLGPTGLRLAFLEEDGNANSYFRAAVTMHPEDGVKLYKMLQDMLMEFEAALRQAQAQANGGGK